MPLTLDDQLTAESDTRDEDTDSDECAFVVDSARPTKWYIALMQTIANMRGCEGSGDLEYELVTHRVEEYPGVRGVSK
jgi:hypothetical protein